MENLAALLDSGIPTEQKSGNHHQRFETTLGSKMCAHYLDYLSPSVNLAH